PFKSYGRNRGDCDGSARKIPRLAMDLHHCITALMQQAIVCCLSTFAFWFYRKDFLSELPTKSFKEPGHPLAGRVTSVALVSFRPKADWYCSNGITNPTKLPAQSPSGDVKIHPRPKGRRTSFRGSVNQSSEIF